MSYSDLPTDEILDHPPLPPGAAFGDDTSVIAVAPSPLDLDAEAREAADLEDALLDAGVPPSSLEFALERVGGIVDGIAYTRAAEAFRAVLRRLEGSAAGEALQRLLLGDGGESLRESSERAGCSHVAVHSQGVKIRRRLQGG